MSVPIIDTPVRMICRKMSPTMTEQEFLNLDVVRRFVPSFASCQFYTAKMIGDTAAPASSMAILTFKSSRDGQYDTFAKMMSATSLPLPFGNPQPPQIEFAPISQLPPPPKVQDNQGKPMASIDEDTEFMKFSQSFEEMFIPPSKDTVSQEVLAQTNTPDNSKLIYTLSARLLGKSKPQGGGNKQQGGGRRNKQRKPQKERHDDDERDNRRKRGRK